MLIYEDTKAVVASRAYELAQTGQFANLAAIERELLAEGFGDHLEGVNRPAIRNAIEAMCAATSRCGAEANARRE